MRRAVPHGNACSHIHPRTHRNATEADFDANRCPNSNSYSNVCTKADEYSRTNNDTHRNHTSGHTNA